MKKTKILLSGWYDLGPIGRHGLSFLSTLRQNPNNEIWLDADYVTQEQLKSLDVDVTDLHFTNTIEQEFDFLIYFHVLNIKPSDVWCTNALKKKAKIKICYPVFDGTVPPLEWVNEINDNFDICCSPSEYCAHNLRRNGVSIDCFGLECVVLIDNILKCTHKPGEKFRFGCVSGYESRKNLPLLIQGFAAAFSKEDPVELFIHSCNREDVLFPFSKFVDYVKKYNKTSNIILHEDFVSQQEMDDIWSTFDAYVIPQRNTGYYTTPLEATAAGLPVILSDIPVHREFLKYIKEKDNLFFVNHPVYTPEFHFVFDYRNIGVGFDSSVEAYKNAFRKLYENRKILYTDSLIQERKNVGKNFSSEKLSKKHNMLIHPAKIALAKGMSHLDEVNGIFYMSKQLAKKYEQFGFGQLENITDDYKEIVYPEEEDKAFQAIEKTALDSQKIYLSKQAKDLKQHPLLESKNGKRIISRADQYNITRMPRFIYKLFSLYCKIKKIRRKLRNMRKAKK